MAGNNNKSDMIKPRDAKLSVAPNPRNTKNQTIKSKMCDDKRQCNNVAHTKGKIGYAEAAKRQGLFIPISAHIMRYRKENPDCSFIELYRELYKRWRTIFTVPPDKMYGSNFKQTIEKEPEWCKAYYCNQSSLTEMAEYRMFNLLNKDDIEDSTVIRAYDTIKKYGLNEVTVDEDEETEFEFGFRC